MELKGGCARVLTGDEACGCSPVRARLLQEGWDGILGRLLDCGDSTQGPRM
jgi:hypothetical protein